MSEGCEWVAIGEWGRGIAPSARAVGTWVKIEASGDGAALLSRTERGEFGAWFASITAVERALAEDTIAWGEMAG